VERCGYHDDTLNICDSRSSSCPMGLPNKFLIHFFYSVVIFNDNGQVETKTSLFKGKHSSVLCLSVCNFACFIRVVTSNFIQPSLMAHTHICLVSGLMAFNTAGKSKTQHSPSGELSVTTSPSSTSTKSTTMSSNFRMPSLNAEKVSDELDSRGVSSLTLP
jgi:hypothetical protein